MRCLCMLNCAIPWTGDLFCPWDSPGKNTGVGRHFLLQGIFPTQRPDPCLLHLMHCQAGSLPLCLQGSPSDEGLRSETLEKKKQNLQHFAHNYRRVLSLQRSPIGTIFLKISNPSSLHLSVQFSSVQSLSHVRLFATP